MTEYNLKDILTQFDAKKGEGISVIDLDLVMHGIVEKYL